VGRWRGRGNRPAQVIGAGAAPRVEDLRRLGLAAGRSAAACVIAANLGVLRREHRAIRGIRIAMMNALRLVTCLAGAVALATPAPAADRNPVVLVHGLLRGPIDRQAAALRRSGRSVFVFNYRPSTGTVPIERLTDRLDAFVRSRIGAGKRYDMVGTSQGSLVARLHAQRLLSRDPAHCQLERLVLVSPPNRGTRLASLACAVPGLKRLFRGIAQMRPGSTFLRRLNRRADLLSQIQLTTVWTAADGVIVPARNALLGVGREQQIPVLGHSRMVASDRSTQAMIEALDRTVPRFPFPAQPGASVSPAAR